MSAFDPKRTCVLSPIRKARKDARAYSPGSQARGFILGRIIVNAFIPLILVFILASTGKVQASRTDKEVPAKGNRDCVHVSVVLTAVLANTARHAAALEKCGYSIGSVYDVSATHR